LTILRLAIALALGLRIGLFANSGYAAEYSFNYDAPDKVEIIVRGEFTEDEIKKFSNWLQSEFPKDTDDLLEHRYSRIRRITYFSPGGSLAAGLAFGLFARGLGLATSVPDNAYCVSACALAWSGGIKRSVGKDARIGYHQVFVEKGKRKIPDIPVTKEVAGILLNWGIPNHILDGLVTSGPDEVFWLTNDDYDAMGVIVGQ
jgi:hypothetical protein